MSRVPARNESADLGFAVVWITTAVLLFDLRLGSAFQIASTLLKVALIGVIIAAGILFAHTRRSRFSRSQATAR
jgi:amino acid transporter